MNPKIKLLLVDDQQVVLAGLENILAGEADFHVIGRASDGNEALKKALELHPDLVVMDLFMPITSGLEATAAIKERLPDIKIMILTVSEREEDLFQALRYGASGYLLKSIGVDELKETLRQIARGESTLSPLMAAKLMAEFKKKSAEPSLSPREAETLRLLSEGKSNAEIAKELFIEEVTVRVHFKSLLSKLHVRNRVEAANYYHRHFV